MKLNEVMEMYVASPVKFLENGNKTETTTSLGVLYGGLLQGSVPPSPSSNI